MDIIYRLYLLENVAGVDMVTTWGMPKGHTLEQLVKAWGMAEFDHLDRIPPCNLVDALGAIKQPH